MKVIRKSDGKQIEVTRAFGGYYESDGELYSKADLDFLPEKETAVLEGWLCRDNYSLNAHVLIGDKPKRTGFGYWENESADCIFLHKDSFPSVTWQSEPKRVRITIEEAKE